MQYDDNFEDNLKKLIEKFGKRETKLTNGVDNEVLEQDLEQDLEHNSEQDSEQEEEKVKDNRYLEYYFHYEKIKDESFSFDNNFKLKKEKNGHEYYVIFFDNDVAKNLREILDDPDLFGSNPKISVEYLYNGINDMRIKVNAEMKRVLEFTEELFKDKYSKMDAMIAQNEIDHESLWYYLDKVNTLYIIKYFEEDVCFKYKSFIYGLDQKDDSLILFGHIIYPNETTLNMCEIQYVIKKYVNTKNINTLKIKKLVDTDIKNSDSKIPSEREKFINYGNTTLNLYNKISHMYLSGKQFVYRKMNTITFSEKHERVMVDYEGLTKYSNFHFDFLIEQSVDVTNLSDDDKMIIFPFAGIYNLGINKNWGITHVKNLSTITYNNDAFKYLVLDPIKKSMIQSLINNNKSNKYQDFIDNKGNGLVFLLYGFPGTGKTLTAEATCEFLNKPMYAINIGDLGTEPDNMETILNNILDLSKRWGAIILIDEVDIFLEEREPNMIVRNAMVSIFLKVLEYHDGIIFLTTNRLSSLDSAVKSRINLMISYQELDNKRRKQIWESLLTKWEIRLKESTIETLSNYKLNGREIRNYMKLVFSVHADKNKEITDKSIIETLEQCFKITEEFNNSIEINKKSMYV